jgi:uncharacterized membrane protein YhaH (DUF805 family)
MNWYLDVLKKYAVFSGRARRKEYWFFVLFNMIIAIALVFVEGALGLASSMTGYGPLTGIYSLAIVIPGTAVAVRRLHDTDRSGWWLFISLIPFIGALVLLFFLVSDSQSGSNQYGPNPKEMSA